MGKKKVKNTVVNPNRKKAGFINAVNLIERRLRAYMESENINSVHAMATVLDVPPSNLSYYMAKQVHKRTIPAPEVLAKIRKKVLTFTGDDMKVIARGRKTIAATFKAKPRQSSGKSTLSSSLAQQATTPEVAPTGSADFLEGLLALVANAVERRLTSDRRADTASAGSSTCLMMPTVLTSNSFVSISLDELSADEVQTIIDNGIAVIIAVRQFYNLLVQIDNEKLRTQLMSRIESETNELVLSLLAAQHVVPAEAIKLMQAQRDRLQS